MTNSPGEPSAKVASGRGAFLWGAATAGHQVEGNNVASDVWLLEHVQPTMFEAPSGDACDSLNRWREDIAIVGALGLNAYRFSVEWARVEPEPGQWSWAMLDLYRAMVDACREAGIAPVLTLSHFTVPRWFAARGGWEHPEAPDLFARFVDKVAGRMASATSHVVTFNEPNLGIAGRWAKDPPPAAFLAGAAAMEAAAAKACGSDRFATLVGVEPERLVAPVIEAHRRARAALKAARGDLPVGMSLAIPDDVPAGPNSAIEAKREHAYGPFLREARNDDFIGVQTYGREFIGSERAVDPPASAPRGPSGKPWFPEAIAGSVRYAHQATGRPVLVTENGVDTQDDAERVRFLNEAVAAVGRVRAEGVPVLGYIHWSLLDNFEWFSGYGPKFGLVAVDRTSFVRTPKPSAYVYRDIVKAGGAA